MKSLAVATKEEGYVHFARLKGTTDWTRMTTLRVPQRAAAAGDGAGLVAWHDLQWRAADRDAVSYPGVGLADAHRRGSGDYNLLYGSITMSIIAVATAALVLDLCYPLFDPRIRLGGDAYEANCCLSDRHQGKPAAAAAARRRLPKLNGRLYVGLTIITILGLGSFDPAAFHHGRPGAQGTYLKNLPLSCEASARHQRAGPGYLLVSGVCDPQLADARREREPGYHGDRDTSSG